MGLGGVCVAFGAVIFILTLAVKHYQPAQGLEGRVEAGLVSLALGIVLLGAGVLMSRMGRGSRSQ